MDKDWVRIYADNFEHIVALLKIRLDENDIPSIVINKKDSAYNMIGEVELYVQKQNVVLARHLLKDYL